MHSRLASRNRSAGAAAAWRALLWGCLGVAAAGAGPAPAAAAPPMQTPEWLVHLARDHGLNQRGEQTAADVLHIQTLLRAGLRLTPDLPDAHELLYELAMLRGDDKAARVHLDALAGLDPDNQTVFRRWVLLSGDARTAEQRRTWLTGLLSGPYSDANKAQVHVVLARLAQERFDSAAANEHLEQARRLAPHLPEVAVLAVELTPDDAPAHERLAALLGAVAANPVQVEAPWAVGQLLDDHGLAYDAYKFYEHALAIHQATSAEVVPATYLRQLSRNAIARGDREAATDFAKAAAQADLTSYASSFYLHWVLTHTEQTAQAERLKRDLAQRFARIRLPDEAPVPAVASAAWFHCTIDPQPQRALLLAESAARRAADDPFVRLVHGWALALNERREEAMALLRPLAERDADAATMVARMLVDVGQVDEARAIVAALRPLPIAGPERARLASLELLPPPSANPAELHPDIARTLAEWNADPLLFHQAPGRFVRADLRFDDLSPLPGEPWWAELKLTNLAEYPISLGPDQMVNPVLLLSFSLEGDRPRKFPGLLTVSLDRACVLAPGEAVSVRRALDLGPPRSVSRRTPQHIQRVSVRAILDPQRTAEGGWGASLTGLALRPVTFNRMPARTSREAWHAVFAALEGDAWAPKYRAIEELAGLLAEAQYARLGRLEYRTQPVPVGEIKKRLIDALRSDAPDTRVRTLEALSVAGMDVELLRAVEANLEHGHWLVRLMAVRLLGERVGASFAERAERISRADNDELVRDMARSYMQKFAAMADGPASAPADGANAASGAGEADGAGGADRDGRGE